MIYIKVNDNLYPASISGKMSDKEWDERESKALYESQMTAMKAGLKNLLNK